MIVAGGVTTQYDQKIVLLMSRSKASPEAACVICAMNMFMLVIFRIGNEGGGCTWASVSAGGEEISKTLDTTKTGLRVKDH